MSQIITQLEKYGLSEREAKVYISLLEEGGGTIADLVKRTKIKRTTLYDVIDALKEAGIVGTSKTGGRTLYIAEDPRTLEDKIEEKHHALTKALPELMAFAGMIDSKPKIRFYEGKDGIKAVYRDTLNYPDAELLAWVSNEAEIVFDEEFLNDVYLPKRIKNKIWVRAILPNTPNMQEYLGKDIKSLRTTRVMDPDRFPIPIEINLYGKQKVSFMSFSENIGLIIESKKIHDALKSIFEQQWESLGDGYSR